MKDKIVLGVSLTNRSFNSLRSRSITCTITPFAIFCVDDIEIGGKKEKNKVSIEFVKKCF